MRAPPARPVAEPAEPPRGRLRLLVGVAVAFLVLDSLLLVIAGLVMARLLPFVLAVFTLLVALGVLLLQRRFSRRWAEIASGRQELRAEIASWTNTPAERRPPAGGR